MNQHPRITIVVATVVLLLAAAGGWFIGDHHESREQRDAAVIKAASRNVVDLMSYDYRTIDKDMARALSRTTGPFHKTMSTAMKANAKDFVALEAIAKVEVIAAAVQSVGDSRATVLLFVDQTVTNSRTTGPTTDPTRIIMEMRTRSGEWRISRLTLT